MQKARPLTPLDNKETLEKIVCLGDPDWVSQLSGHDGGIALKEFKDGKCIMHIDLHSIPSLLVRADPERGQGTGKCYSHMLQKPEDSHHNKACDAVFFFVQNGALHRLFVELKSSRKGHAGKQLHASLCFVDYMCRLIGELSDCLLPTPTDHFTVLKLHSSRDETLRKVRVSRNPTSDETVSCRILEVGSYAKMGFDMLLNR